MRILQKKTANVGAATQSQSGSWGITSMLPAALLSLSLLCALPTQAADKWTLTQVGGWTGIGSMTVSQSEDYIVFSQKQADGTEKAFEVSASGASWGTPKAIDAINKLPTVGGLFMTDDCRTLYFHAKVDEANGYDIYVSQKNDGVWGKPEKVTDLCSAGDDMCPSVVEGGQEVYFLRHQTASDARTEKKEANRLSIYHAKMNEKTGKWSRILPINPAVSFGFVQSVRIMRDGKTLLYSTRPEKRDNARPVFTRSTIAEQWLLPEYMIPDDSSDFLYLQNAGSHLYVLVPDRKGNASIFCTSIEAKYATQVVATEKGKVVNMANGKPVCATFEVRNPTSSDLVGRFTSSPEDGSYNIVCKAGSSFLVEARADGYSYFAKLVEYDNEGTPLMPRTVELFDTATLGVTLFDGDIFQPIDGKVIAVRQSDKAIFRSVKGRSGWYQLSLPVGSDYNIIATARGFGENSFIFKETGDVVFNHYEREIPMSPVRRDVVVNVFDDATKEPISTEVTLSSLERNEVITLKAGETKSLLRDGDRYVVNVHPTGYMFANFTVDLAKDKTSVINVPLTSLATALSTNSALKLNNILFDTNQAFLRSESYAELDRLVNLMNENPGIKVELRAHADNVGSAAYNLKLTGRRAASVMQYLIENGIDEQRLKSVGFGSTKPIASNATEEGRQQNRRVEFIIVE